MTQGYIKPICLPSGAVTLPPDNISMIAAGWGYTAIWAFAVSPILRHVTVQSILASSEECLKVISDSRVQFCAGVLAGGKGNLSTSNFFNDVNYFSLVLQMLAKVTVVDRW
jgi:hypothetical protein